MLNRKILTSLMVINTLCTISISSVAFASTPVNPPGCPDGWVPATPPLNPQLGCIPNRIKPRPLNGNFQNPNPNSQFKFPPEIPQDFQINKCQLGVIDSVDCPENNPIPAPRN
ncbi:hypothetical protein [Calothrix sp. UHCC 0171]|uniref:hypothetical protein n=1 Tax=Calothrix sp. UHCC 0171 TaxID=3110245 RepID=UPI002B217B4D|nr:hypothetical protein [Calothrix sp. UHCC 0171]MEA5572499.1 hypothetical protein [Calothrix sp. UHCC 0171]